MSGFINNRIGKPLPLIHFARVWFFGSSDSLWCFMFIDIILKDFLSSEVRKLGCWPQDIISSFQVNIYKNITFCMTHLSDIVMLYILVNPVVWITFLLLVLDFSEVGIVDQTIAGCVMADCGIGSHRTVKNMLVSIHLLLISTTSVFWVNINKVIVSSTTRLGNTITLLIIVNFVIYLSFWLLLLHFSEVGIASCIITDSEISGDIRAGCAIEDYATAYYRIVDHGTIKNMFLSIGQLLVRNISLL